MALIGARQAAHGKFDAPVGEDAPAFHLGQVGGLGIAVEPVAGDLARFLARQEIGLAPPRALALPFDAAELLGALARAPGRDAAGEVGRGSGGLRHGRKTQEQAETKHPGRRKASRHNAAFTLAYGAPARNSSRDSSGGQPAASQAARARLRMSPTTGPLGMPRASTSAPRNGKTGGSSSPHVKRRNACSASSA